MGTIVRRLHFYLKRQDRLDDKIDKLTLMMNKSRVQGNNQNKQFKPNIYQGRRRGQSRNYYDQGNYQGGYRSNNGDRRTSYRGRGHYGQNYRGRPQYVITYRNVRRDNFRETQNYRSQNFKGGHRNNNRYDNFGTCRNKSRKRQYSGNFRRDDRSSKPVLTEIELDVLSVGNMIILLKTA